MNIEERDALDAQLTTTMTTQWSQFQKERREWEEEKDAARERKREESARSDKAKYDQLLELQIEDATERQKAAKLRNKLLGAILAIFTTVSGSGAYMAAQPAPEKVESKEVKAAVESAEKTSEARFVTAEGKIERLGIASVDAQITQSAGVDYIAKKIDAASPKAKDKVKEPPEVEAARIRSGDIKKKKRRAELLGEKYDPFADLPKP